MAIPRFRWHILRALLHKEVLRLLANRGAIALALLLIVAALLISLLRMPSAETSAGVAPRQDRVPRTPARAGRPHR